MKMRESGYPRSFAVGITGASAVISPKTLPSITCVHALFLGGVV